MDHSTIWDILFVFSKAEDIKRDPEKREKSVRFAVECIILSVFMAGFLGVGGFLLTTGSLLIIVGIILLVFALSLLIMALVRLIAQFTINRHTMTWVALAVFLASVLVPVIVVVCLALFLYL